MPHVDAPQSYCRAGIARRDITPPVGIYHRMWGAATHDRSTGIHRPLLATALALAPLVQPGDRVSPSETQVVVGVDHCLLWQDDMDALRAAAAREATIGVDQLHVAFSHTHAAGLMDPGRAALPGGDMIAPYLATLAQAIGHSAREAIAALRPASIVYGRGHCDLAQHRDFWDEASRQFACGFNPAGPRNDTVLVARVEDEHGTRIATVVNYACHPTTLAWDNTLISPDYVGATREVVERSTAAPCLFLQGASGDLGPREGYVGDVAVADRNGRELGYAALAALEALPPAGMRFEYAGPVVSGATIGTWVHRPLSPEALCQKHRWQCRQLTVELPYRPDLPDRATTEAKLAEWQRKEKSARDADDAAAARDCRAEAERMTRQLARLFGLPPGKHLGVVINVWNLGDAVWVLVPGEYYNLLARSLHERFGDRPIVLSTVTDGWRPGYVPTVETYGRGVYQETVAVVAAGSLERVIAQLGDEIARSVGQ